MSNKIPYDEMKLRDLKTLAKERRIPGWHEMKKDEIIAILTKRDSAAAKSVSGKGASAGAKGEKPKSKGESPNGAVVKSSTKVPAKIPEKSPAKEAKKIAKGEKPDSVKKVAEPPRKESKKVTPIKTIPSKATPLKGTQTKKIPNIVPSPKETAVGSGKNGSVSHGKKIVPSKLNVFAEGESTQAVPTQPTEIKKRPVGREEAKIVQSPSVGSAKAGFLKEKLLLHKTLETPSSGREIKDRIVLLVCGPFWLHAWWEISGNLISRVRAAMGHLWHTADPILRLYRVFSDGAGLIHREFASDILIHGGIYNWFINVDNPPGSFLVEIGYKARDGQFFSLVSSNIVETPHNYIQESMGRPESGWRMLASSSMFSPLFDGGSVLDDPSVENVEAESETSIKSEADPFPFGFGNRDFDLQIDAEVVIKGKTSPDVQLTIKGERIWLKEDGSFLIRYHLPERRHVFPVVAVSRDGIETKTIVLAVERNTKNLETVIRDQNEDES